MSQDERLGWNPLRGMSPLLLLEKLERQSVSDGYPRLIQPPGPRGKRWSFVHHGDGLTHSLMGLYRTTWWATTQLDYVPVEAITDCGVLALLKSDQPWGLRFAYDAGHVVEDYVTCLFCAGGAPDGLRYYHTQKEFQFGNIYGK